jgi:hypothetical protein
MTAVGVARPRAQGQATTITEIENDRDLKASPVIMNQPENVTRPRRMMRGTK